MTDAIQTALSMLAFAISAFALFYTRTKDRIDVFLRIHEQLIGEDGQKGRDLLGSTESPAPDLSGDDRRCARRALARFQLLGLYVQQGKVRKADVMALWAPTLFQCHDGSRKFVEDIKEKEEYTPWEQFFWLADEAEEYLRSIGSRLIERENPPSDWHAWHRKDC